MSKLSLEEVALARDAFVRGWKSYQRSLGMDCYEAARKEFPLKVVRPRVVKDSKGGEWSFTAWGKPNALLMHRNDHSRGWFNDGYSITPDVLPVLADLFANPTEECDE